MDARARRLVACPPSETDSPPAAATSPPARSGFPPTSRARRCASTSSAGRRARPLASEYSAALERARGHAATLLGVEPDAHRHGIAGLRVRRRSPRHPPRPAPRWCASTATSPPSSAPFLARGDLRVRHVPLAELADAIGPDTWMASYSLVQSATGEVADAASVAEAARAVDARVLVDTTQATGWMPTADLEADLIVCHAYKWLSRPARGGVRGVLAARARRDHAAHRGMVLGHRPVGVLLRPRPAPRRRREPIRRLPRLARVGRRGGRARVRRVARRR